jgi:uncharacterized membrane protein
MLLWYVLSILPFYESRYVVPLIVVQGGGIIDVVLVSLLNSFVFFLVLLFLDYFHKFFIRFDWYRKAFDFFECRIMKNKKYIDRYGYIGLTLFVFLPIPVTGVYSASILSWILKLDRNKSYLSILLGVLAINTLLYLSLKGFIILMVQR